MNRYSYPNYTSDSELNARVSAVQTVQLIPVEREPFFDGVFRYIWFFENLK